MNIKTISFYRYTLIANPNQLRDKLFETWKSMGVLGRVYLSREGINAQISVPEENQKKFELHVREHFPEIPFKYAVEEHGQSFRKLHVRLREKIVADGLEEGSFDVSNVGRHLSASEFNSAMDDDNTIVVDMRNHYECEVGHFEGAYLPKANTFREALPEVKEYLQGHEKKKILLYCTGGIRCEKASSWLKHQGYEDVNQLHGGIIDYARQIISKDLPSRFKGVNFVFDQRLGERITSDVLSHCHQCDKDHDEHVNCRNPACNLLFIQCDDCHKEFDGCCSFQCRDMLELPREKQIAIQNELENQYPKFIRSRYRPDLKKLREQYLKRASKDYVPGSVIHLQNNKQDLKTRPCIQPEYIQANDPL